MVTGIITTIFSVLFWFVGYIYESHATEEEKKKKWWLYTHGCY